MRYGNEMTYENRKILKKLFKSNRWLFKFVSISFLVTSIFSYVVIFTFNNQFGSFKDEDSKSYIIVTILFIISIIAVILIFFFTNKEQRKIEKGDFSFYFGRVTFKDTYYSTNRPGDAFDNGSRAQTYIYVDNIKGYLLNDADCDTTNIGDPYLIIAIGSKNYSVSAKYFY